MGNDLHTVFPQNFNVLLRGIHILPHIVDNSLGKGVSIYTQIRQGGEGCKKVIHSIFRVFGRLYSGPPHAAHTK